MACLVLWVEAWVNDAIHVQVEVVKLNAVGVGLRRVHRDFHAVDELSMLLNAIDDYFWVSGQRAWNVRESTSVCCRVCRVAVKHVCGVAVCKTKELFGGCACIAHLWLSQR